MKRRLALRNLALGAGIATTAPLRSWSLRADSKAAPWLELAVQQYSFNRQLNAGAMNLLDYRRMLKIVKDSGFRGYIGIEFEGHGIDPVEGINSTKRLIQTVMAELA